jgi:hypothetical protein
VGGLNLSGYSLNYLNKGDNKMKTYRELTVYVTGIKKRQRKVKRHGFKGGQFASNLDDIDLNAVIEKARDIIKDNMRVVADNVASIGLTKIEEKDLGNGFVSKSFMMFEDNYSQRFAVEG